MIGFSKKQLANHEEPLTEQDKHFDQKFDQFHLHLMADMTVLLRQELEPIKKRLDQIIALKQMRRRQRISN